MPTINLRMRLPLRGAGIVLVCILLWAVLVCAGGPPPTPTYVDVHHHRHPQRAAAPIRPSRSLKTHRSASRPQNFAGAPTPGPTGKPSASTTVYIRDAEHFALLLPKSPGESISDAETDAVSFCYGSHDGCANALPSHFITSAHVSNATSGSSQWIQITGCIDPSNSYLARNDPGGQYDVRFPQGAQCSFGGYGASFIELVEPAKSRFCLRCCARPDDQENCNSHHDRDGCLVAVPGVYSFGNGVSCED